MFVFVEEIAGSIDAFDLPSGVDECHGSSDVDVGRDASHVLSVTLSTLAIDPVSKLLHDAVPTSIPNACAEVASVRRANVDMDTRWGTNYDRSVTECHLNSQHDGIVRQPMRWAIDEVLLVAEVYDHFVEIMHSLNLFAQHPSRIHKCPMRATVKCIDSGRIIHDPEDDFFAPHKAGLSPNAFHDASL